MTDALYRSLAGSEETGSPTQRRNFFLHAGSLTLTKLADGLIDPKIVLSWLLTALGAPAALVGLLVPVREAGALLPQVLIAPWVQGTAIRKTFWALGSVGQGLCVGAIALAALTLEGAAAGWAIVGALAAFSLCRAVCSTSYKDVLGKTVEASTRGAATGLAASAAAGGTLLFGALLAFGVIPRTVPAIAAVVAAAGVAWILAGMVFLRVREAPSEVAGADGFGLAALLRPLREDAQLRVFIAARALLVPTALAPPFLIALAAREEDGTGALGPFVLASALAAILSGYVWGRLSDRSSRRTFMASGALAALALGLAAALSMAGPSTWAVVALLFVAQVGYQGVRMARSIHLVDMAAEDRRAVYTALSNTIIGVVLLAAGALGLLAQVAGLGAVLAASAALCLAGVAVASRLDEVQGLGADGAKA